MRHRHKEGLYFPFWLSHGGRWRTERERLQERKTQPTSLAECRANVLGPQSLGKWAETREHRVGGGIPTYASSSTAPPSSAATPQSQGPSVPGHRKFSMLSKTLSNKGGGGGRGFRSSCHPNQPLQIGFYIFKNNQN